MYSEVISGLFALSHFVSRVQTVFRISIDLNYELMAHYAPLDPKLKQRIAPGYQHH